MSCMLYYGGPSAQICAVLTKSEMTVSHFEHNRNLVSLTVVLECSKVRGCSVHDRSKTDQFLVTSRPSLGSLQAGQNSQ